MNKHIYKSAIDNIRFSEDLSKKTLDYLSSYNSQANNVMGYKKLKKEKRNMVFAATALILVLVISIPMIHNKSYIELPNSVGNVSVKYINKAPSILVKPELVWLTEKELFHKYNVDIFMGKVEEIRNIKIDFNGSIDYRAIAKIKVKNIYRGDLKPGETVSVLLPSPIDANIWVKDTEVISSMKIAMTGIFMPMKYDDTSYSEENGARLHLKDIAEYGFLDGMRYTFLSTENGLVFDKTAYKSIDFVTTLEEVEQFIMKMIE